MFVDVHAHIDMLKDPEGAIKRAESAGLKAIIANGTNPQSNRKVLEFSKKYDIVKPALGAYPTDILEKDFDLDAELDFISKQNPIALGEVGLDNHHEPGRLDEQRPNFQKIINLAEKMKIPVIVHSRKAELETIEMLEASKAKVVMHCFGGNKKLVNRIIENKWNFSIPTNIVRSEHFQMIVNLAPMRQILTETDAPFLSPFPDKDNEPAFISESVKKIAEIKNLTLDDASQIIFSNYQRIF